MKNLLFYCAFLLAIKTSAQANFTIVPQACKGATMTLTGTTGTLSALGYSWAALPAGPVLSSTNTPVTTVTFPSAGTFSIGFGIMTMSGLSYTVHTIVINPDPPLTVTAPQSICIGSTSTLTGFGATTYTWTGTTFTGSVNQQSLVAGPGIYTLSGSDNIGCKTTTILTINMVPPLSLSVSASSATTCVTSNLPKYSKTVKLTASGASTYIWFPYNGIGTNIGAQIDVRPAASTCYTVVGSTSSCSGTATICIPVIPQFSIGVSSTSASVCLTQSVDLAVTGISPLATGPSSAFTYMWYEALNAPPVSLSSYSSPTVSAFPQNSTTYTVEVRDADNCVSEPVLIAVTTTTCLTGIAKNGQGDAGFTVHPNPAKDLLYIRSENSVKATVTIMDALGKTILKENKDLGAAPGTNGFSVSMLPAGVYFVQISTATTQQQTIRFIKD